MLSRRKFMQVSGVSGLAGLVAARPPVTSGASQPLVITVHLRGGWDGLFALAPVSDPRCLERDRALRLSGRSALLRVASDQPGADWRLHSKAEALAPLFADGSLAALPRFGPARPARGHLDGRQRLARAPGRTTGWLTDAFSAVDPPVIAITPAHPPLDISGMSACVLSQSPCTLIVNGSQSLDRAAKLARIACVDDSSPVAELARRIFTTERRDSRTSGLTRAVDGITRALREGLDVVAAVVEDTGWDTHERQAEAMEDKLADLAGGLARLWGSLRSLGRASGTRVIVLSEFGRALEVGASGGTEHGHAGTVLVLGGGRAGVLGAWEPLSERHSVVTPDRACAAASASWSGSLADAALLDAAGTPADRRGPALARQA